LACFSRLSVCHRLQPVETDAEVLVNSRLEPGFSLNFVR